MKCQTVDSCVSGCPAAESSSCGSGAQREASREGRPHSSAYEGQVKRKPQRDEPCRYLRATASPLEQGGPSGAYRKRKRPYCDCAEGPVSFTHPDLTASISLTACGKPHIEKRSFETTAALQKGREPAFARCLFVPAALSVGWKIVINYDQPHCDWLSSFKAYLFDTILQR